MEFFMSWSHSDALFTEYFPECPLLVSALPDNKGTMKKFRLKPQKLIIDCGSVFHVKQKYRPTLKDVFNAQLSLLEDSGATSVQLVHFDEPMLTKTTLSDRYKAMERTLFNAYEYLKLFSIYGFSQHIQPMGVIQGYDKASIEYSAYELIKMGYQRFGIGSLLAKHYTRQIEMIGFATDMVGPQNLHVFGVTGIPQMHAMVELGVRSFDSTRPTMAAAFFQVFYSRPFRTYFLSSSHAKLSSPRLSAPLPCECPVCIQNPEDIFKPSPRDFMKLRSVHNYYHLRIAFNDIVQEKRGGDERAISNVLRSRN
ncbi:queuine tRNA-ribosyltransferase [Paenibacillus sp. Marseille-P2973]|uniref:queuine tRNA-ribosyltransferase n=1 Tax=Paenibacillus sp. Marseille-P2973 TaxID=1871032 RepID=UPI001B35AE8B|nr:queuine tRNA-ribosyltransferase [Paenibacillus sp. Marseille-P2973]MBQ4899863.1 queuine tRNA-ribosyltransferase [Paenibacillus sp. Marseille-P2973]